MSRAAQSQNREASAAAAMMGARARPAAGPACTGPQAPPPRNHRVGNRTRSSRWGAQDPGIPRPRRKSLWRLESAGGGRAGRGGPQRRLGQARARAAHDGRPRGPSAAEVLIGSTVFRRTWLQRDAQIQARQERWAKGVLGPGEEFAGWLSPAVGASRGKHGGGGWSRVGSGSGDCFARPPEFLQGRLVGEQPLNTQAAPDLALAHLFLPQPICLSSPRSPHPTAFPSTQIDP